MSHIRKLAAIITSLVMIYTFTVSASALKPIRVLVGGEELLTDVPAMIHDGRKLLPVRAVFEEIGAKVSYDATTRKVTAVKEDRAVELTIDSDIMTINGEEKILDVPAMIQDGRTLVPLRACAEAFDLDVEWNDKTRTAKVKKAVSLVSETSEGVICEYDENGNETYWKNSEDYWEKPTYDANGNIVYWENSQGYWDKYAYDENGNEIYW